MSDCIADVWYRNNNSCVSSSDCSVKTPVPVEPRGLCLPCVIEDIESDKWYMTTYQTLESDDGSCSGAHTGLYVSAVFQGSDITDMYNGVTCTTREHKADCYNKYDLGKLAWIGPAQDTQNDAYETAPDTVCTTALNLSYMSGISSAAIDYLNGMTITLPWSTFVSGQNKHEYEYSSQTFPASVPSTYRWSLNVNVPFEPTGANCYIVDAVHFRLTINTLVGPNYYWGEWQFDLEGNTEDKYTRFGVEHVFRYGAHRRNSTGGYGPWVDNYPTDQGVIWSGS